jgi:hypothetical protein
MVAHQAIAPRQGAGATTERLRPRPTDPVIHTVFIGAFAAPRSSAAWSPAAPPPRASAAARPAPAPGRPGPDLDGHSRRPATVRGAVPESNRRAKNDAGGTCLAPPARGMVF